MSNYLRNIVLGPSTENKGQKKPLFDLFAEKKFFAKKILSLSLSKAYQNEITFQSRDCRQISLLVLTEIKWIS